MTSIIKELGRAIEEIKELDIEIDKAELAENDDLWDELYKEQWNINEKAIEMITTLIPVDKKTARTMMTTKKEEILGLVYRVA